MHPLRVALPACLATRMPAVSDCAKYMGRKRRSVDNIRCNSAYLRRPNSRLLASATVECAGQNLGFGLGGYGPAQSWECLRASLRPVTLLIE